MITMTRATVFALLLVSPMLAIAQAAPQAGQPAQSAAEWQRKHDMALKYPNLEAFFNGLKKDAAGTPKAALPDWSGVWTTAPGFGGAFTPGPGGVEPKVTPTAKAEQALGREMTAKGISYDDNLSQCGPAGFPRWLNEPFLREYIVTPRETWLINEQVNEIRRIYTDGRGHEPEADAYPLPEGDSIGVWDGQKLIIHTNQLQARSMGRTPLKQSDKMETVEIWEKTSPTTISVDIWIFDPRLYTEPWYFQKGYVQMPDQNGNLRIRYWNCGENPNNEVVKTGDGDTARKGYTFVKPKGK
jgi:hypothetical protein